MPPAPQVRFDAALQWFGYKGESVKRTLLVLDGLGHWCISRAPLSFPAVVAPKSCDGVDEPGDEGASQGAPVSASITGATPCVVVPLPMELALGTVRLRHVLHPMLPGPEACRVTGVRPGLAVHFLMLRVLPYASLGLERRGDLDVAITRLLPLRLASGRSDCMAASAKSVVQQLEHRNEIGCVIGGREVLAITGDRLCTAQPGLRPWTPRRKELKIKDVTSWPAGSPDCCSGSLRPCCRDWRSEGAEDRRSRNHREPPGEWYLRLAAMATHRLVRRCSDRARRPGTTPTHCRAR
jgi:hypothetical protein